MKTWHYIAISIILILLVIIGLFHQQIKTLIFGKPSVKTITSTQAADTPSLDFNKVLKRGMMNSEEVKLLQTWLGGLAIDGDFGPLTEQALNDRIHFNETTLANFQQLVANETHDQVSTLWSEDGAPTLFNNGINWGFNWIT